MTTLRLTDPSGPQWDLHQIQRSEDPTQASTDVFNAPGVPSEETFIAVLSEQETITLTGLVTAPRLAGTSTPNTYSSDWRTALAQYAARGEAFAHSAQHTGYTLAENDRGRSLNVVIEEVTWTVEKGAPYQLSYELTLRRGEGLLPDAALSVANVTPGAVSSVPTLGGVDLAGFERLEATKSLGELTVTERAFAADAGENDITASQGARRSWTYSGRVSGTNAERNAFDDSLRGMIDDSTRTFQTVLPGYSATVKVVGFDSTRSWQDGDGSHEYTVAVREATSD